jgi:hypothetical protein
MPERERTVAERLQEHLTGRNGQDEWKPEERGDSWEGERPPEENGRPKAKTLITAENIATIDDLIAAGSRVEWLWPGWLQTGVLTAIAAPGGTGKTRFCADLIRRIRHQLGWPDSSPITLSRDARFIWVVSDNHHDELVTLAEGFRIKESIRINAYKEDPYTGVCLDSKEDLFDLDARIGILKPALVIIDTVGNSTDRNLSKQEEAKAYYWPLQVLARRHRTAILCLTHLNADGHFLGRRILEKVRVAIRMEQPDLQNDKRRLEIRKSNSKRPAPLGLIMGDFGNEYDHEPPGDSPQKGPIPIRVTEAADWLKDILTSGPKRVSNTRNEAEMAGFAAGTLYRAKDLLSIEQFEAEGKKWWRLPSN